MDAQARRARNTASPQARKPRQALATPTKLEWKPKGDIHPCADREARVEAEGSFDRDRKPEWKPKGSFDRDRKPEWKPKGSFDRERKPEWKPKGSFDRDRKPEWKPKAAHSIANASPEWKPRTARSERKLEWKPRTEVRKLANSEPGTRAKRKWVPKEEYKKSKGIESQARQQVAPRRRAPAIRVRSTRTPRRPSGRSSSRTSGRTGTRSKGVRRTTTSDFARRPVPSARDAHRRSSVKRWSNRFAAPSAAFRRSSAPRSASASCSTVLAMKHKWPSTMNTRPSSSSIPKPTYAPTSIIPRTSISASLLFTSAEAVLAYDFLSTSLADLQ